MSLTNDDKQYLGLKFKAIELQIDGYISQHAKDHTAQAQSMDDTTKYAKDWKITKDRARTAVWVTVILLALSGGGGAIATGGFGNLIRLITGG